MKKYILSVMKGQTGGFFPQLIICLLLPLTVLYRLGVLFHQYYCQHRGIYKASKPVISIGNITVGGVGKTPLVIWLARSLKDRGLNPVVLIRGFMTEASAESDEALMIKQQIAGITLLSGADRVGNIKKNASLMADLYICDDAFQHWPLGRDLNIVAIDAGNPFGNGHLLPVGILREPLSALKRADIFVFTKINASKNVQALTAQIKKFNSKALIVESRYTSTGCVDVFNSEVLPNDFLKDKSVLAFSAIGDPLSFESQFKDLGAKLAKTLTFMDHHSYQKKDIQAIVLQAHACKAQLLVCTHKDAVKLQIFKDSFDGIRLVYIPIQLEILKGSDEFIQKIITVCRL